MTPLQKGIRVLKEDGFNTFLKKLWRYIRHRIPTSPPLFIYKFLQPDVLELEVNNKHAEFDMGFVTPHRDFRHDYETEKGVISEFMRCLRSDDVVFDIGANIGLYSSFAGQICTDGHVIAFEPHPVAVPTLYQNMDMNCNSFHTVQLAISKGSGYGTMDIEFSGDAQIMEQKGLTVPVKSMKSVLENDIFDPPDIVKVDVEGAERDVLQGFGDTLKEIDVMFVEVHHRRGKEFHSTEPHVREILEGHFDSIEKIASHERGGGIQTHFKATSR